MCVCVCGCVGVGGWVNGWVGGGYTWGRVTIGHLVPSPVICKSHEL